MKRCLILFSILVCVLPVVRAESNELFIGLDGGGATFVGGNAFADKVGAAGMIDFGYAHFWKAGARIELGLRTGLCAGYAFSTLQAPVQNWFPNMTYMGHNMDYDVRAMLSQKIRQVYGQVPVMFALRHQHFTVELGAKLMVPAWSQYEQTVSDAHIEAYYRDYGNPVRNEIVTGVYTEGALKGQNCLPRWNVLMSFDINYEWVWKTNKLGLGAYVDFAGWSSYQPSSRLATALDVSSISDPSNPPAVVSACPISEFGLNKMLYLNFGLRIYYAFEVMSKKWTKHGQLLQ